MVADKGKTCRKTIALVFLTLHFVACLFYFVSDSIWMLLLVRFIHGLGFGASANAIMVIGMASLPMSRYGEATGYFMLSTSLGIAIVTAAGFHAMYYTAAGMALAAIPVYWYTTRMRKVGPGR